MQGLHEQHEHDDDDREDDRRHGDRERQHRVEQHEQRGGRHDRVDDAVALVPQYAVAISGVLLPYVVITLALASTPVLRRAADMVRASRQRQAQEAAARLGPDGVIDEITASGLRGRGGEVVLDA